MMTLSFGFKSNNRSFRGTTDHGKSQNASMGSWLLQSAQNAPFPGTTHLTFLYAVPALTCSKPREAGVMKAVHEGFGHCIPPTASSKEASSIEKYCWHIPQIPNAFVEIRMLNSSTKI